LLEPDAPSFKILCSLFELGSGSERECILVELLSDICSVASSTGVSAEALAWLLPVLYAHVLNHADEAAIHAAVLAGTGAVISGPGSVVTKLTHVQAKGLLRHLKESGFLAHREAYLYALEHPERSIVVERAVQVELPLPITDDLALDRAIKELPSQQDHLQ